MTIKSIGVHIKVKNFKLSKQFYKALGFKQVFSYGPDQKVKEAYKGCVFEHGGAKLEIADGHRAVKPAVFKESIRSSKLSLMISLDSLIPLLKRCKQYKVPIAVQPRHYYWGTLEVVIRDPDGTVLVFIAPYSPTEAKKIKADETFGQSPA